LALALASASEQLATTTSGGASLGGGTGAAQLSLSSGSDLLADAAKVCPPSELPALLSSFHQGSISPVPLKIGSCSSLARDIGAGGRKSGRAVATRGYYSTCGGGRTGASPSALGLAAWEAFGLGGGSSASSSDHFPSSSRGLKIWEGAGSDEWQTAEARQRWGRALLPVDRDLAALLLDTSGASSDEAAQQQPPAAGPTAEERRAAARERVAKARAARSAATTAEAAPNASQQQQPVDGGAGRRRLEAAGFRPPPAEAAGAGASSPERHLGGGSRSPAPEDTAARGAAQAALPGEEDWGFLDECPETEPGGTGGGLSSALQRIRQACPRLALSEAASAGSGAARLAEELVRGVDADPTMAPRLIQAVVGVEALAEAGAGPSALAFRAAWRVVAAAGGDGDRLVDDLAVLVPWLGAADAERLLTALFNDASLPRTAQLEVLRLLLASCQAWSDAGAPQATWSRFHGLVDQAKALGTLRAAFAEHMRCGSSGGGEATAAALPPSLRLDAAVSLAAAQAMWLLALQEEAAGSHAQRASMQGFLPVAEMLCPFAAEVGGGDGGFDFR